MAKNRKKGKGNGTKQSPPASAAASDVANFGADWIKTRCKALILSIPGGKYLLIAGAALVLSWPAISAIRSMYEDTIPRIDVFGSNPSDPFALPFTVTNASEWFDMKDAVWACDIDEIRSTSGHATMKGITLLPADRSVPLGTSGVKPMIPRKQMDGFRCGVAGAGTAHIVVRIHYKTLWFDRAPVEQEFNWISGRWFRGNLH